MALSFTLEYPLLHWTAVGTVGHEDGLHATRQSFLAIEATGERGWHILIDLTRSEENRTASELRELAQLVAEQKWLLSERIAAVAETPLLRGTSRMFAVYMEDYGVDVRVFGSMDEARAWLVTPRRMGAGCE